MLVMVDGSQFPDFKPNYYTEWELLAVSSDFTLARTLIIAKSPNYAAEKKRWPPIEGRTNDAPADNDDSLSMFGMRA